MKLGESLLQLAVGVAGATLLASQTNWQVGVAAFLLAVYIRWPAALHRLGE